MFNTLKYGVNVKLFACRSQVFPVHLGFQYYNFCSAEV